MKNKIFTFSTFVALLFFLTTVAYSQTGNTSWNQFRGPDRNGISSESLTQNKTTNPEAVLMWKKPIGAGFSELVIEGDKLYTMESEAIDTSSGNEFVSCYDAQTSALIWKTKVDSLFFDTFGDGPRSTPVIGEKYIYSFSSYGKLSANSKKDGALIWQVDVLANYGPTLPRWGFSSSPMLVGNTLVIEAGGAEEKAFIGFDKVTGDLSWSNGNGIATYCSPILAEIDGKQQIIFANQQTLFSMNEKGDTLWTHTLTAISPTAMPIFFEGNKLFVSSLQSKGFSIVEVNGTEVNEILTGKSMKNDYSSSLYHDGHFYGFNVAALQCISATTGEKKWTKRGLGKGSLIMVGNTLLALSDKGKLVMAEASGEKYNELGKFQALKGKSWTAPSFSEGRIYLRNLTEMTCYEIK